MHLLWLFLSLTFSLILFCFKGRLNFCYNFLVRYRISKVILFQSEVLVLDLVGGNLNKIKLHQNGEEFILTHEDSTRVVLKPHQESTDGPKPRLESREGCVRCCSGWLIGQAQLVHFSPWNKHKHSRAYKLSYSYM